jgi:TetR/AcrR family tetracycline transcriptional repressor
MPRPTDFELGADEIVAAAVQIFNEAGLDAVSMRSVSSRLGVSPIPLYSRIGNKDALVDAMADRLLADLAPAAGEDEEWGPYAARWARALRARLQQARDSRLILAPGRAAYLDASRPLVKAMRRDGLAADVAVQACRLLMWATVGFGAVASGATPPGARGRPGPGRPGGDPTGLDDEEVDALFELHIRYLIDGIARDAAVESPVKAKGRRR